MFCVDSLICGVVLGAIYCKAIFLPNNGKLVNLIYFNCVEVVCILCFFFMVQCIAVQSVIVVFDSHIYYLLDIVFVFSPKSLL